MDIYKELGVKTYINAWDAVSSLGNSRMEKETFAAMREASKGFVEIGQLQKQVGRRIAKMTGNEAAYVTCGSSAAILIACAVCMVRHPDPELFALLPDASELKNEIIVLRERRNSCDFAIAAAGGRVVEAGEESGLTLEKLEEAITDKTAAVLFFDTYAYALKCPPLAQMAAVCHRKDVFMVVEASGQLPPRENLWRYTVECGADLALFSGSKALRGPQQGGLVVGRRSLIDLFPLVAPPRQGIARAAKEGREEIVAVYAAVRRFLEEGVLQARLRFMRQSCDTMAETLQASGYFTCETLYPGPTGQNYRWLAAVLTVPVRAESLWEALRADEPGVYVGLLADGRNGITINPLNLTQEEVPVVTGQILKNVRMLLGLPALEEELA